MRAAESKGEGGAEGGGAAGLHGRAGLAGCGGRSGWGMCGAVPVAVELPQTRPGTELGLRGLPAARRVRGVGRNECRRPALSGVPAAFPPPS